MGNNTIILQGKLCELVHHCLCFQLATATSMHYRFTIGQDTSIWGDFYFYFCQIECMWGVCKFVAELVSTFSTTLINQLAIQLYTFWRMFCILFCWGHFFCSCCWTFACKACWCLSVCQCLLVIAYDEYGFYIVYQFTTSGVDISKVCPRCSM